eukprot:scaffold198479_cov45-Prasinocladus_malaysianus.AAC.1
MLENSDAQNESTQPHAHCSRCAALAASMAAEIAGDRARHTGQPAEALQIYSAALADVTESDEDGVLRARLNGSIAKGHFARGSLEEARAAALLGLDCLGVEMSP